MNLSDLRLVVIFLCTSETEAYIFFISTSLRAVVKLQRTQCTWSELPGNNSEKQVCWMLSGHV